MSNYAFEGPKWSGSVITWSFAAAGGDFSNTITTAYQATVRAAIARWSQVANLSFKESVDSAAINIRIGWAKFTGTQLGETNYGFSSSGINQTFLTGIKVRIADPAVRAVGTGISSYYQNSLTTLYQTVLHELGHALGLAHSTDPTSIMYASIGLLDNDLNSSDIQGIEKLYGGNPMPAVVGTALTAPPAANTTSSTISVYRFFDASNGTQFLTADLSERNIVIATRPDLTYEGAGLGALSSAAGDPNAVPVYRFFDTRNGSHFFTTSGSENGQILATRSDLVAETPSFYEHATRAIGDIPVYRFFDGSTGTHFFTASDAEKDQLQSSRSDFSLEGIAFYAPSVPVASGLAQAGSAAVQASPLGTPQVNTSLPVVTSVVATPTDGLLKAGGIILLQVSTSRPVNVTGGTPTLALSDGGTAVYDAANSTPTQLTFSNTVQAGENTPDLTVTAGNLNGALITDSAGQNLDLAGAVGNPAGTLEVDTIRPTALNVIESGSLQPGGTFVITFNYSEVVIVSGGTPKFTLTNGGIATRSSVLSTPTSSVFTYQVQPGDDTNNLQLAFASFDDDHATAVDMAGNPLDDTSVAEAIASAQGNVSNVSEGELPMTVDVYRFFDTKTGTHFYTQDTAERASILNARPDLVQEGASGVGLTAVDPVSNDPNAVAVYRFYDLKHGTHFFTASLAERDNVIGTRRDMEYEPSSNFYEHIEQQAGDTAVYRFFDTKLGTHFYTGDLNERASILQSRSDLVAEGISFYEPARHPAT